MTPTLLPPPRFEIVSELPGRCDRCDAAAKLELTLPGGGGLFFCGHHANRHAADILRQAERVAVVDGFEWRGLAAASA
jgi:hypothetical protein